MIWQRHGATQSSNGRSPGHSFYESGCSQGQSPDSEPLPRSVPLLGWSECPVGAIDVETPLFICYANCCRSVLAYYLYRHLHADDPALSAGLFAGECINDRALGC